jgi:ABC-type amino acid transport substrate-binding protein
MRLDRIGRRSLQPARARLAAALLMASLLCGCDDFPRDARGTLEELRAGQRPLRVGWSPAEPWVRSGEAGGPPAGLEPALLRDWAAQAGLRIEWVAGGPEQIVAALRQGVVDIGLAGFPADAPGAARTGWTQTYLEAGLVVGAAPGVAIPRDWEGVEIRHHRGRPDVAAAIRRIGAVAVPAEPAGLAPLAAVHGPELSPLGLVATGKRLGTEQRVIATAPGENALTLALDRFLLERRAAIESALAAEAGR